jgi:hypothetical protein
VSNRDFISTLSALSAVTAPHTGPPLAAALASAPIERSEPPVTLRGVPRSVGARELGRGLELTVHSRDEVAIEAALLARRRLPLARRHEVVLAADVSGYAAGSRRIELRADACGPCGRSRSTGELRVVATDRDGRRRSFRRAVSLRR